MAKGKLNNAFTHFGSFKWGQDPKLRGALEKVRERYWPSPPPIRLKVRLGEERLSDLKFK